MDYGREHLVLSNVVPKYLYTELLHQRTRGIELKFFLTRSVDPLWVEGHLFLYCYGHLFVIIS